MLILLGMIYHVFSAKASIHLGQDGGASRELVVKLKSPYISIGIMMVN